mmetsp:Transcript_83561/g.174794  ORF Transcript_83561/g.174794 Transcript_83561/m.174794 type:complete len:264 (-) Transcript_83561:47-838(-)|eukprot:CAMPEP_0206480540 /NCGR_PEP_ID=MMETSP0324_2-20121206/37424_1 /ASSEMBLY_ACC=CAM_ASM_000836 /TAXON_ID=2866 /ORGANISM="Crypthecodinium cohnii, Strain Seligo" /LENGTH=263 /DNA_ID=CAMNT_0053957485 /DNA_START=117 /DNA_END=908 /DNA_ORIENTATION=-
MSVTLKKMELFLTRAEEHVSTNPLVAHYIRLYVLANLMKAKQAGEEVTAEFETKLLDLFQKVEDSKKQLDLSTGQAEMEAFALQAFNAADAADRSGRADVAKTKFHLAGQLLDVCSQFHEGGELPPFLFEKAKQAKLRCVIIHKALAQGLPVPPPPELEPLAGEEAPGIVAPDAAQAFQAFQPPLPPPASTAAQGAPPSAASAPPQPPIYGSQPSSAPCVPMSQSSRSQIQKKVEYAASALDFGDVSGGRKFLLEALQMLDAR